MRFIRLKSKGPGREAWHQVLRQNWPKPLHDPTFSAHVTSRAFTLLQNFPRDAQHPTRVTRISSNPLSREQGSGERPAGQKPKE